jgi:hypothetical protein
MTTFASATDGKLRANVLIEFFEALRREVQDKSILNLIYKLEFESRI